MYEGRRRATGQGGGGRGERVRMRVMRYPLRYISPQSPHAPLTSTQALPGPGRQSAVLVQSVFFASLAVAPPCYPLPLFPTRGSGLPNTLSDPTQRLLPSSAPATTARSPTVSTGSLPSFSRFFEIGLFKTHLFTCDLRPQGPVPIRTIFRLMGVSLWACYVLDVRMHRVRNLLHFAQALARLATLDLAVWQL